MNILQVNMTEGTINTIALFGANCGVTDLDAIARMRREPLPPTNEVFDVPQEEIDGFWNF